MSFFGSLAVSKNPIKLVELDLGPRKIQIPVFDLQGKNGDGKTLLITAGMDGDEYAGMEAAYQFIEQFKMGDFCGRLIIIPCFNIPGFEAEESFNPLDMRHPRDTFPGTAQGKPTERLIYWLMNGYASSAHIWCDLHGGGGTERLRPFLWMFETGEPSIQLLAKQIMASLSANTIVSDKVSRWSKAVPLARRGCLYFMAESGDRRCADDGAVQHVKWMHSVMSLLHMISPTLTDQAQPSIVLKNLHFLRADFDGFWRPLQDMPVQIGRHDIIGMRMKIQKGVWNEVRISHAGQILYWKETHRMKRGEILAAIGY
ncbi:hypothetical protein EXS71_00265 [Candidatus Uhrbacteria bacterium]|nr:hypothetical protein [Candidatus Uhrbacteria bacterium]